VIEKPLERLNYFNGQRLEASDLKTEQDYHIRVRRWLNKSLYSAGIADGLEVRSAGAGRNVIVSPGLALDSIGREIILLEEETVEIFSYAGTDASTVEGNYLVVEYSEEKTAYEKSSGCAIRHNGSNGGSCGSIPDGPSRVQSKVKFSSVRFPPPPGSNQVALARIELADDCSNIGQIDTSIRRYIGPASQAKVRQYALEGEREVAFIPKEQLPAPAQGQVDTRHDIEVVGRIYFHVRGLQARSVTLFLRSDRLSMIHYTELGLHTHGRNLQGAAETQSTTVIDQHFHAKGSLAVGTTNQAGVHVNDGAHQHSVWGFVNTKPDFDFNPFDPFSTVISGINAANGYPPGPGAPPYQLRAISQENGTSENLSTKLGLSAVSAATAHAHGLTGSTGEPTDLVGPLHKHSLSLTLAIDAYGASEPAVGSLARSGNILTHVEDLQVSVGLSTNPLPRTTDIRQQLADANQAKWLANDGQPKRLGDGTSNHVLAMDGTGGIRLDFLPNMAFDEGEYCIELRVGPAIVGGNPLANGGKILYNLYIE
jgi:hypothetical protein